MVQIKYLVALAPFALLAFADDQSSSSDSHDVNLAHSTTTTEQGGYFGGCGLARRDQTFGNNGGGGNVQGNSCRRSENVEADLEARDMELGFDALDALHARDDQTSSSDSHDINAPTSTTGAYGGGYFGGCARSMFGLEERSQTFGDNAGGGNVQGNHCRRSDELAIRDIGAVYRRHLARSYSSESEAVEAADMLRRHAEHLGMV